ATRQDRAAQRRQPSFRIHFVISPRKLTESYLFCGLATKSGRETGTQSSDHHWQRGLNGACASQPT
ncbi:MAG: hypothetical protein SNJ62_12140, partial [Chloracidobacterium sp.]